VIKTYPKSSFWSQTDTVLLLFLIFGSGVAIADNLETFGVTVLLSAAIFGLYFGVNWLVKTRLYKQEIGIEVNLDVAKKILQIGEKKIKFSQIKLVQKNYLRRIGWRFTIETKSEKIRFILTDQKELLADLKEILPVEVFSKKN
jgi:hypothetical protein